MYSRLLSLCTVRGFVTRFSLVGPTRVKACKSFLITEKFPFIENKEHLLDFVYMGELSLLPYASSVPLLSVVH